MTLQLRLASTRDCTCDACNCHCKLNFGSLSPLVMKASFIVLLNVQAIGRFISLEARRFSRINVIDSKTRNWLTQ